MRNSILDQKINTKLVHHVEIIDESALYELYERYEELSECEDIAIKTIVAKFKNILESKGASSIRTTWRTRNYQLVAIVEWRTCE